MAVVRGFGFKNRQNGRNRLSRPNDCLLRFTTPEHRALESRKGLLQAPQFNADKFWSSEKSRHEMSGRMGG
jgi:hypothetical protein